MTPAEVADRQLGAGNAFGDIAVNIVALGKTGRRRRSAQRLIEKRRGRPEPDIQFAAAAVIFVVATPIPFRTPEIGQHVREAPSLEAELAPLVVIARMAARVTHG